MRRAVRWAGRGGLSLPAACLVLVVGVVAAGAGERIPKFSAPVVDEAGVVPEEVERSVGQALNDYQARTGNQLAVAVVRTTGNQSIEDYSIDLAREWGVGQEGRDNGAVLVIAMDDRTLRIEVGRGLEGDLTDLESGRIVRDRIVPLLRAGDVGGAVSQGTVAMRQALGDPNVGPLPPAAEPEGNGGGAGSLWPLLFLVPFGFGALFLRGARGRAYGDGRRRRRRGWGAGAPIIWGGGFGGGGFGGGGFGGGGGGGFGGGGGGGFGGGGASGGW